jgi:hypothetical protein
MTKKKKEKAVAKKGKKKKNRAHLVGVARRCHEDATEALDALASEDLENVQKHLAEIVERTKKHVKAEGSDKSTPKDCHEAAPCDAAADVQTTTVTD